MTVRDQWHLGRLEAERDQLRHERDQAQETLKQALEKLTAYEARFQGPRVEEAYGIRRGVARANQISRLRWRVRELEARLEDLWEEK